MRADWHEYGMRVGFWRMKAVLDELKIVPSLSVNARVCLDYPRVAKAARDSLIDRDRGWIEFPMESSACSTRSSRPGLPVDSTGARPGPGHDGTGTGQVTLWSFSNGGIVIPAAE